MRILFTGGGGAATEAWVKLLPPQRRPIFADANEHAVPSFAEGWEVPRADAADFVDRAAHLCKFLDIDLLVPGVDEELLPIAEARATFPCPVLLPHAELIARHLDKVKSMAWLSFVTRVPQMLSVAEFNHLPLVVGEWVLKPIRGRGSRHVAVVGSSDDVRAYLRAFRLDFEAMFLQQRIEGQEYTVTVVADQAKRLRAIVPVRVDEKRGVTIRGQAVEDEAVTDVCRKIHAADPFSGVINVQGIKTADGQFVPFEINPRISTTTCLAVAAGVDVFALAMEPELAPFKSVTLRRFWQNEFV